MSPRPPRPPRPFRPVRTAPRPSYDPAAGVMPSREELDAFAVSWPSGTAPLSLRPRLGRRLLLVTVRGHSMEPTYRERDRVLVLRGTRPLRGRVIVLVNPHAADSLLIKRVLAIPGDPVPRHLAPALSGVPEHHVPAGSLVLVGDNPGQSLDSRQLG